MLKIRKEQIKILGEYIAENFYKVATEELKQKYPAKIGTMSDNQIREFIDFGISKAEKFNIVERADVLVFLNYMATFGKDFDELEENYWARKILKIKNLRGIEKIRRIIEKKPV